MKIIKYLSRPSSIQFEIQQMYEKKIQQFDKTDNYYITARRNGEKKKKFSIKEF